MSLLQIMTTIPLFGAFLYAAAAAVLFVRRREAENHLNRWLIGYLMVSAVWQLAIYALSGWGSILAPGISPLLLLATILMGTATSAYIERPRPRWWLPVGLFLVAAATAAALFLPAPLLPNAPYLTWSNLLAASGWLTASTLTYVWAYLAYRRTPFPWHANRYLYWATMFLLGVGAETLIWLNWPITIAIGQGIRLAVAAGFVYGATTYIRFDVRTRFWRLMAVLIVAMLSAVPASLIIFGLQWVSANTSTQTTAVVVLLTTTMVFLIYVPYRSLLERFVYRYMVGSEFRTSEIIRSYNSGIGRALDITQLSAVIINQLSEMFGAGRGALFLVNRPTPDQIHIQPIPALGHIPRETQLLDPDSPFIRTLTQEHQPLLQYDIDFDPAYREIRRELWAWLTELSMEMYVPIVSNGRLTGFIALGPKTSGHTYRASELEALQLLADQTVVALENARLYTTLGEQNDKVRHLNENLVRQNKKLEAMDRVKADFITIASHELRTPLTQVKGYSDILSSMNEENALTREQTREIANHIDRATGQLEQLITAMLDASQIDADGGIELNFTNTKIETVIRLAADPLKKAMQQRRITFVVEGAKEMPPILADFKRMVQAFTNLFSNAIKYTPDGGRITISAELQTAADGNDHIQIAVADTGIGIDPKYHELVFEKFFRVGSPQLHSTGNTKFMGAGPGLGLPIARGVVAGHDGRIWVESTGEDKEMYPGSTFYILLPVNPPSAPDPSEIESRLAGKATAGSGSDDGERPPWLIG